MAKGQMRGNREKKKPKADKSKTKQAATDTVFSSNRFPGQSPSAQPGKKSR
jgi:hypothetical protein